MAPIRVNRAARFKHDTAALKAERIRIKKKKRRKWIILSLVLLVLLLIGATAGYIIYRFFENVRPEVTIEAGSGAPRPEDFLYEKLSVIRISVRSIQRYPESISSDSPGDSCIPNPN